MATTTAPPHYKPANQPSAPPGPSGVRANAVCPGWTRTEMADLEMAEYGAELGLEPQDAYSVSTSFVPSRRPAEACEVGRVIAWLLADQASYSNAAVLPVDGGMIAVDPGSLALDPRVKLPTLKRPPSQGIPSQRESMDKPQLREMTPGSLIRPPGVIRPWFRGRPMTHLL
ncbi:SDR family oxidoreductase [Arthrobacter sp. MI7-26]|uniref:SDR family oxidoreductase n=1 Tax=Arthrobacter sp. MI7-26 TaxID=2993653 RepID=UPI00224980A6|nr:SDR family oxidoreductase [Arthrobacter sp. MI7-26]MCX2749263.1 SDR family oxidoreductase [Arthrobacter sp. MI7-26]